MISAHHCDALDMVAVDLPRLTCRYATATCKKTCYAWRPDKIYPQMHSYRAKVAKEWRDPWECVFALAKNAKPGRVRIAKSGDIFGFFNGLDLVEYLATARPDVFWWIPTKAWRGPQRRAIRSLGDKHDNLSILASIDDSTYQEAASLVYQGWPLMYHSEHNTPPPEVGLPIFLCPKTWDHAQGSCATCSESCFSASQVLVWLKKH